MNKPPYKVPTIAEIHDLPWNGYRVVSLFSGGGGSCTGYAAAGFHVAWASEFIEEAARTYRANHPDTILDTRDVRTVTPEEILAVTGLKVGELDLLDGSPPCSSFSMAGKREKGWGEAHTYSDGQVQRTDNLFAEAIRILRGLKPKTFLFENVAGMVRGVAKGHFLEILRDLKASGYRVEARLIDASYCGVPQSRVRLLYQGVRSDLALDPVFPKPLPYRYSVRDALPWIGGIGTRRGVLDASRPAPTVQTHGNRRTFSELTAVDAPHIEPECDISRFAIAKEWDKIRPGEQSARYFQLVKPSLDKPCPTVTATGSGGAAGVCHPLERRKFSLAELKAICSFPPDYILTGKFAQQWERCGRSVPPLMMKRLAETVRDEVLAKVKP